MGCESMARRGYDIGVDNAHHGYLVVDTEELEVNERGRDLRVDAVGDTNAHLGVYGVEKGEVDQSDSNITVEGAPEKSAVLNRVDHCGDIDVKQDNTNTMVEAADDSNITAVNYITNTRNYTSSVQNSDIRVRPGRGGITAHTIVGGNTVVTINQSNTVSHVG